MKNSERTILVMVLLCVLFVPVISAEKARGTAEEKRIKALELLDKYAETQDKLKSFIARSYSRLNYNNNLPSERYKNLSINVCGKTKGVAANELRSDGKRISFRHNWYDGMESWDKDELEQFTAEYFNKRKYNKHLSKYQSYNYDGRNYITNVPGEEGSSFIYPSSGNSFTGKVYIIKNPDKSQLIDIKSRANPGHALMGYFYGDDQRVDSVIRKAKKIYVRDKMEEVGVTECYVIDAVTRSGKYILWIDPEHGYNITKAKIVRKAGNLVYNTIFPRGYRIYTSLENVRFEKIDGVWVPMEADIFERQNAPKGFLESKKHHKRTEVILNPDHDALGSFVPDDVRNGSLVHIVGNDRIKYIWRDGEVVDANGKVIMSFRKELNRAKKESG